MTLTILSWNVNGLRTCYDRKYFLPVFRHNPGIVCVQETKAPAEKLPEKVRDMYGYHTYFSAVQPGSTAGVGLFTRQKPLSVKFGFGDPHFDNSGRVLIADYGTFLLLNIYFPLGIKPMGNLDHKLRFYDAFLTYIKLVSEKDRPVIVCGDFNVAHTDKDLYNPPKKPVRQIGISPDEREKIDCLIQLGFTDTFRMFQRESGHYTRWPFQNDARKRNFGWRLDYVFVNEPVRSNVLDAAIMPQYMGSDHCPVMLEVDLPETEIIVPVPKAPSEQTT
ncbi:exodeoxyribonuclease III [Methanoregula sp.]|jgi:exodeoxyribonuclease-3|uniref:exodeoxyribonuclease III n=1 Tax=Methanoregula sp. TaxID=2052170 RepID=UPI0025E30D94|nr:exodeoxyribonuclease III [Methanoregula sp.]